ncbi:peptide deformylase [uncultured Microscilla sp.]|uniref:peptide deformylase n=1 Tax=uncultured Microscilla sp. TaxID=432653 RepID=UPI002610FA16|nr:peptide deformylase [uncultured Microscilla sp.]
MIYPIVAYGDPVLKKKAEEIEPGTDISELVENMFETMYEAHGVGLAAPQIGKSLRLFVIDPEPMDEALQDMKMAFINPVILEEEGTEWAFEEGCLSIPDIRENVSRQPKIRIKYFDLDWKEHEAEYDGMAARVIQHEYDHIEGVLFTDYLSGFKKRLLKSRLTKISKGDVRVDYRMRFPAAKK